MGLFKKEEASGLRLVGITTFNCGFNKKFFKLLQGKLGFDDAFMERIEKAFVSNIICKIEYFEDPSGWSFERAKVWETIGKNTTYSETEDPFNIDRPYYFYGIKFWELLTEQENETDEKVKSIGVSMAYDPPTESIIMYIDGDEKFEIKTDSFVDLRPLKEVVKEEAVLLQIKPYDFNWLKEYDDASEGADSPDDPMYYLPTDKYRRWSNWKTKGARDKFKSSGVRWTLEIHDFVKNVLPPLGK